MDTLVGDCTGMSYAKRSEIEKARQALRRKLKFQEKSRERVERMMQIVLPTKKKRLA
jgi:hypothetical protein